MMDRFYPKIDALLIFFADARYKSQISPWILGPLQVAEVQPGLCEKWMLFNIELRHFVIVCFIEKRRLVVNVRLHLRSFPIGFVTLLVFLRSIRCVFFNASVKVCFGSSIRLQSFRLKLIRWLIPSIANMFLLLHCLFISFVYYALMFDSFVVILFSHFDLSPYLALFLYLEE